MDATVSGRMWRPNASNMIDCILNSCPSPKVLLLDVERACFPRWLFSLSISEGVVLSSRLQSLLASSLKLSLIDGFLHKGWAL